MIKVDQLAPPLRFPEFQNAPLWNIILLQEYLMQENKRNEDLAQDLILSVNNQKGFIRQSEQFIEKRVASDNLSNYRVVHKGDIAYNPSRINVGSIAILEDLECGVISPMYVVFRTKDNLNPYFFLYCVDTYAINQKIRLACSGSVRDTLSFDALSNLELAIPKRKEQKKIVACLSSIDKLIMLEEKKLDTLHNYKKGLMKSLFPTEGKSLPKFRFPEFKNNPAWAEKPLNKVFTRIKKGNTENNSNCLTISAQHGLVNQLDYFNKRIAAKDLTGYCLLHKGNFAYNKSTSRGYPMGAIKRLKLYSKGVVSNLYICFKINNGYSGSFFEHFFEQGMINSEIEKIAQEGARNHGLLNVGINDFFEKVNVKLPKINEQRRIAIFLSNIDNMIATQEQKNTNLKEHKKGLIQKIFPDFEE